MSSSSSDSTVAPCYTEFDKISKAAQDRQNDVIDIVSKIEWQNGKLYLLIPPTHHLVDIAFHYIKRSIEEKGLVIERSRLLENEVEIYRPKINRKGGGYFVCIAADRGLAKEAIRQERFKLLHPVPKELPRNQETTPVQQPQVSPLDMKPFSLPGINRDLPPVVPPAIGLSSTQSVHLSGSDYPQHNDQEGIQSRGVKPSSLSRTEQDHNFDASSLLSDDGDSPNLMDQEIDDFFPFFPTSSDKTTTVVDLSEVDGGNITIKETVEHTLEHQIMKSEEEITSNSKNDETVRSKRKLSFTKE